MIRRPSLLFTWVVLERGAPDEEWLELGRLLAPDKRSARELAAARWPGTDSVVHSRAEYQVIMAERGAFARDRIPARARVRPVDLRQLLAEEEAAGG